MSYEEKVAAVVSAYEDDFVLLLSIPSIAPHVDEVWIHDDASRDRTPDVVAYLCDRFPNVRARRSDRQQGQVRGNLRLLEECRARHVFLIDADDVLYPQAVPELKRLVEVPYPYYSLGLREAWGDVRHTRRGIGVVYDAHHRYMDRARETFEYTWDLSPRRYHQLEPVSGRDYRKSGGAMFFHMCGVRDDHRLALRSMRRQFEIAGSPCDLRDWEKFRRLPPERIVRRAEKFLFDGVKLQTIPDLLIPPICLARERFEIVFDAKGAPTGRIDRGFSL